MLQAEVFPKIQKNTKKFKKFKKVKNFKKNPKNSNNSTIFFVIHFCVFFLNFFDFVGKNRLFEITFFFWNLENLRIADRVNPGVIELEFFSSFFWYIKRVFSTSYAKVMAVTTLFFCLLQKRSKFLYLLDTQT